MLNPCKECDSRGFGDDSGNDSCPGEHDGCPKHAEYQGYLLGIAEKESAVAEAMAEVSEKLRDALEGMVWQFGYRITRRGKPCLSAGGLSALEDAFRALGWCDPYSVDESMECDVENCHNWRSSQIHWDGMYSIICDVHFKDYCGKEPRPQMKASAISREASRDAEGRLPRMA